MPPPKSSVPTTNSRPSYCGPSTSTQPPSTSPALYTHHTCSPRSSLTYPMIPASTPYRRFQILSNLITKRPALICRVCKESFQYADWDAVYICENAPGCSRVLCGVCMGGCEDSDGVSLNIIKARVEHDGKSTRSTAGRSTTEVPDLTKEGEASAVSRRGYEDEDEFSLRVKREKVENDGKLIARGEKK